MSPSFARPTALATLLMATLGAQAAEVCGSAGVPGVMLGLAQPFNEQFTLRADLASAGHQSRNSTEEGIAYTGRLTSGRVAVFGDGYPRGGGFRFTAGLSSNQYRIDLDASGAGRTVQVGDHHYTLGPGDGQAMQIRFPGTTPYLGIGWGTHGGRRRRAGQHTREFGAPSGPICRHPNAQCAA